VVVASGATQTVTFTVPDDARELLLGCHISDHWERGMAGAVRLVRPGGVPVTSADAPNP
jgi:FtsP/CotA-like multicopper oxidase with cupredoxin domain